MKSWPTVKNDFTSNMHYLSLDNRVYWVRLGGKFKLFKVFMARLSQLLVVICKGV